MGGEELTEVKWGMIIIEFKKSALERQIKEAVLIQQEAKNHTILNSKSEWNQSAIPRLTTRTGDMELWEMERELKKEKEKEEQYERKIRELRKEMNRVRLKKDDKIQPNKRRKLENEEYVSIRNSWGHPE